MTVMAWIALLLHLAVGYFYVLSGLVAPQWAVAGLLGIWLVLLWGLMHLRRERWKPLVIPAIAAALWFGVLMLGDVLLGWTA
ncbi:MAG TPA: hypothetical protein VG929_02720 [Actinomycetota bacterium]|nr:hypothetical protein [Actinomycetota bacterium]